MTAPDFKARANFSYPSPPEHCYHQNRYTSWDNIQNKSRVGLAVPEHIHLMWLPLYETILWSFENILSTLENFIYYYFIKFLLTFPIIPPKNRRNQVTWPFKKHDLTPTKKPKPSEYIFPYILPRTHFPEYNIHFCRGLPYLKTSPLKDPSTYDV